MSTYDAARKSHRYRIAALSFISLLCSCGGGSGGPVSPPPPAPVFSLQLGQENPLLTTAQRASFGHQYGPPDGTLGVLLSSGTYMFFAASRSSSTCTGTPLIEGTYRLGGTLTAITAPYGCSALIQPGADPNGYTFDRDYAGGGPVLPISNTTGQTAILHIYHGEWHGGSCANTSVCFYASLGMALSKDGGTTFTKLGEVVQPNVSRASSIASSKNLDVAEAHRLLPIRTASTSPTSPPLIPPMFISISSSPTGTQRRAQSLRAPRTLVLLSPVPVSPT
jgi:hypothetical protein